MSDSEAKLTIRLDPTTEREYPLGKGSITIGREAFNDIVIYDPEASRRHAQISYQEERYVIEDLGSTNGTYVNGRRLNSATPLHNGDVIEIGETVRMIFTSTAEKLGETVIRPEAGADQDKTVADPSLGDEWKPELATSERFDPDLPGIEDSFKGEQPGSLVADDAAVGSQESLPSPTTETKSSNKRYLIGCGCLLILAVVACGATLFLLDAYAPDALYNGPLEPLFDFIREILP
jgi:pSer/pThr/pTyr-binding forkhead associated (FHA) protein